MRGFSLGLVAAVLCGAMCLNPEAARAQATDPYLGEIQAFGFNFCPRGWAPLNGQLMAISQNTALFSLLGTFYGGNGTTTFALTTAKPIFTATGHPLYPMHRGGRRIPTAELITTDIVITAPRHRMPLVGIRPRLRAAMRSASGCKCSGFAANGGRGRGNPRFSAGALRAGTAISPDTGRFRPFFPLTL